MLIIIAKRNNDVQRFVFPVPHPDDIPLLCQTAQSIMAKGGCIVLYRMFAFVDCGKAVVYDVDENGKWGEA